MTKLELKQAIETILFVATHPLTPKQLAEIIGEVETKKIYAEDYKPKNLNSLIIESEKLCKGIDFVRLDVYDVDGVYYFGEFTFTPMGGNRIVEDDELEKKWGSWVN